MLGVVFALTATLAFAPSALAATFTVDSAANDGDLDAPFGPFDGQCDSDPGAGVICTLRAAIEEAENNDNQPTIDTIQFDNSAGKFDGDETTSTIAPAASDLPTLNEPVAIVGGACAGGAKPCVGIDVLSDAGLRVNAPDVSISGIAFFGLSTGFGIRGVASSSDLSVRGSWFGVDLDEDLSSLGTGIELQKDSDDAVIGGTAGADRNVFTDSDFDHILMRGADDAVIRGNYFGTMPDGSTAGATTPRAIRIQEDTTDVPTGNVIGGPDTGAPGVCDTACNLFANLTSQVIHLSGILGPGEAGSTTIAGNYLGLSLDGASQLGSAASEAIDVAGANNITVGGASADTRNFIGEYTFAVTANSGAVGLALQNNFFGLNDDGTARIGDGAEVAVGAGGTSTVAPTITGNRIAAASPTHILALGTFMDDSEVTGNVIGIGTGGENVGAAAVAINVDGDDNVVGGDSAGERNVLGNTGQGVEIFGDRNTVAGNVFGTDASGAQDHPITGVGVRVGGGDDNVIGGTTAASENAFENIGDDAIGITGVGTDQNRILRNRGSAAADQQFIDLTNPNGFGNTDANSGIGAPEIGPGATSQSVGGSDAAAGATVRVYRTESGAGDSEPADVVGFVGSTTADGGGSWTLTCPGPGCATELPGSGQVTANSTDTVGNSSELSIVASYTAVLPNTAISSGPAQGSTITDRTPTFGFSSNEAGSTFQCRVDGVAFASCANPRTLASLGDGQHTFQVRARDTGGNLDGTPASRTFRVDATAPETTIDSAPKDKLKAKRKTAKAMYEFSSEAGASFECSLDGTGFEPCSSPLTEKVKKGKHTFEVRAADAVGNVDATPAEDSFKVKKKKQK